MSQYEQDDFENRLRSWMRGDQEIYEAFPDLTPSAREFIKTGLTEDEWDKVLNGKG